MGLGRRSNRPVTRAMGRTAIAASLILASSCGGGGSSENGSSSSTTQTSTVTKPTVPAANDDLRLNQIQVVGTHNSFHLAAPEAEHDLLAALDPTQAAQRTYSHAPLPDQLEDQGVRQLELDVFADASGGLYADPALRRQAGLGPYLDEAPEMAEPGTKVLHEQDVDYHSVCPTVAECLDQVKTWSDAHPSHVPIAIHVQMKDGPLIFAVPDQAKPEPWDAVALDRLDEEIRSVFPQDRLITPDDVRKDHATLEAAVLDQGWPTLGESRGKVMFLMINGEPYRSTYRDGHPNLEGRVLFTNAVPGQPDASHVNVDNPLEEPGRIEELVRLGYLVRTRADAPDVAASADGSDTSRRAAALASGAQWVSTDHPGRAGDAPYSVALPDDLAARCNPIVGPEGCRDEKVEPVS